MNKAGRQVAFAIAKRKEGFSHFMRTSRYYSNCHFSSFSMFSDYHLKRNDEERRKKGSTIHNYQLVFFSTTQDEEISMRDRARNSYNNKKAAAKINYEKGKKAAKRGAESSFTMMKQYGPVFVGFYAGLYGLTFGSLYIGIDSGLIDPGTVMGYLTSASEGMEESRTTAQLVVDYLKHYSWTQPAVPFVEKNPHFANLAVAWVTTKFTEPIRLVITAGVVPRLAKYLGFVPKKVIVDDNKEGEKTAV